MNGLKHLVVLVAIGFILNILCRYYRYNDNHLDNNCQNDNTIRIIKENQYEEVDLSLNFTINKSNFNETIKQFNVSIVLFLQLGLHESKYKIPIDFYQLTQAIKVHKDISAITTATRIICRYNDPYPCEAPYTNKLMIYNNFNSTLTKKQIYSIPTDTESLVEWIYNELYPNITVLKSVDEHNKFLVRVGGYAIVAEFKDMLSSGELEMFKVVAVQYKDYVKFAVKLFANDRNRVSVVGAGRLVNMTKHLDEPKSVDELESFIKLYYIRPLYRDYNNLKYSLVKINYYRVNPEFKNGLPLPIVFIFTHRDTEYRAARQQLMPLASQFHGQISMLQDSLDTSSTSFSLGHMELPYYQQSLYPLAVYVDNQNRKYIYRFNITSFVDDKVDIDGFNSWINQCLNHTAVIHRTVSDFIFDLTNMTIDSFIRDHEVSLILLYYGWDGHSKRLQPIIGNAALSLANDSRVGIGRVDCGDYTSLCNDDYKIMGTPTLMLFSHSTDEYINSRARTYSSIIYQLYYSLDPFIRNESQLNKYINEIGNIVVEFGNHHRTKMYQDKFVFFADDSSTLKSSTYCPYQHSTPCLVGFIKNTDPVAFKGGFNSDAFLEIYGTEPLSNYNIDKGVCDNIPCIVIFSPLGFYGYDQIKSMATTFKGYAQVYYQYQDEISKFEVRWSIKIKTPSIVIIYKEKINMIPIPFQATDNNRTSFISSESIRSLLNKYGDTEITH